ncbi:MAG: ABC transporter ATP-binding protein [Fuerstiella sp.]|jgi:lipopolysaccharide transport system ATP-binding protein|nr:ABC transporter ATP-binding protein [Fuerstiella sp.]MCP4508785.1 ABC transporter ATP-binding protein [Fuerstiella sp.]
MTQSIISVRNLGKSYLVGHQSGDREKYTALRDVIGRQFRAFGRKTLDMARGRQIICGDDVEEFWALDDVSFDVSPGEVVGIIGRNGAGKSTLLKVLSRITEPTRGQVRLRGRVASLLEVGTGFHPELTGRENIFLNGAILGMSRNEIKRKFDEIVDFAEVERFLDTPVKRYSSGMYVRLAFSVAAHLEPEILVVDEVLAVGDMEFQRKCLGKMSQVASGGRTILFVSHNMNAVERLCTRAVVLDHGTVGYDGPTQDAIMAYASQSALSSTVLPAFESREGSGAARITAVECPAAVASGVTFEVTVSFTAYEEIKSPDVRLSIYSNSGHCISNFGTSYTASPFAKTLGDAKATLRIPSIPLNIGRYSLNLSVSHSEFSRDVISDRIENAASFEIVSANPFGTGKCPAVGSTFMTHSWSLSNLGQPEHTNRI